MHIFPPIANDDVDIDNISIPESVARNDDGAPSLIYEDDDALFHSDHTDDESDDQVLGANKDRYEGGNYVGGKFDDEDDDTGGNDIGNGNDVGTGNGIGSKDAGNGVSACNNRDLGANYTVTEMADTSFWHALVAAKAYTGGEPVIEVMGAEYAQLTNQKVHIQTNLDALSQEQENIAFNPINLVKVQQDGHVEGQLCVDWQLRFNVNHTI